MELILGILSGNKEPMTLEEDLNTLDFPLSLEAAGFINVSYDYILVSRYHGKNEANKKWTDNKDNYQGIITKSDPCIEFDDDKKTTTIDTPGGNKVVISDDEKSILLSDHNRNMVELKPEGITLDSPRDIKITSKSKITIDATSGAEIFSVADVKVARLNINQNANVSFTAKGNASAELSAARMGDTTAHGGEHCDRVHECVDRSG